MPGEHSTARRWQWPLQERGWILCCLFLLKVTQFFQGRCREHSLWMLESGCWGPESDWPPGVVSQRGRLLLPFRSRSLQDSVFAEWNFSFMTLKFFLSRLCFPLWAILTYPVFRLRSQQLSSGQSLRLEGFCFVIPMKCCFLGKICSFFFFYIILF